MRMETASRSITAFFTSKVYPMPSKRIGMPTLVIYVLRYIISWPQYGMTGVLLMSRVRFFIFYTNGTLV